MSNQPYYQNQTPYTPSNQTSSLAIASLISGLLSWFLFPIIGAIVAVITGHSAKNEIRASGGRLSGDGMATAGLILGYIQLGLTVISLCVALLGFALISLGVCAAPFWMDPSNF